MRTATIITCLFTILLMGCNTGNNAESVKVNSELVNTPKGTKVKLSDLVWMEGLWGTPNEPKIMEKWSVVSDQHMQGEGFKANLGLKRSYKTTEYLSLTEQNGQVYYEATAIGQNNNNPIKFLLTKQDSVLGYQFINPDHDFPQLIAYKKLNHNELLVTVGGINTDSKRFTLHLIRENDKTRELVEDLIREQKQSSMLNP